MINSISNNQQYQYQTNQSKYASNLSAAAEFESLTASSTQEDTTALVKPVSQEEYSAADYMDMMRNGKTTPDYTTSDTETSTEEDISSFDTDSDGTISEDELTSMLSQMGLSDSVNASEFFTKYDTNGDGEISLDEIPDAGATGNGMVAGPPKPEDVSAATVSEYDTDGDGVLSAAEYSAMMEALRGDSTDSSSTDLASEILNTSATTGTSGTPGDISSIDADNDGTISADEYVNMLSEMGIKDGLSANEFFTLYDTNGDGEISADEMPEPGTVGAATTGTTATDTTSDTTSTSTTATSTSATDAEKALEEAIAKALSDQDSGTSSLSASYQKMILQALAAYENNYESMFDTTDGTLLSNQA